MKTRPVSGLSRGSSTFGLTIGLTFSKHCRYFISFSFPFHLRRLSGVIVQNGALLYKGPRLCHLANKRFAEKISEMDKTSRQVIYPGDHGQN